MLQRNLERLENMPFKLFSLFQNVKTEPRIAYVIMRRYAYYVYCAYRFSTKIIRYFFPINDMETFLAANFRRNIRNIPVNKPFVLG